MSLITFPVSSYPIKVIAQRQADTDLKQQILAVSREVLNYECPIEKVNPSKNNNYLAITISPKIIDEMQLNLLLAELKKINGIQMLL